MKILIIGSGKQGTDMAKYLIKKPDLELIKMTDIDVNKAKEAEKYFKNKKVTASRLDAGNVDEIVEAAKGMDIVVNAVIPKFNLPIMDGALKANANYIDLASGPPYENAEKQLALTDKWKEKKLTALMNTGASPGASSVVIATLCDKLDKVDEINCISGFKTKPGTKFLEGKEILESTWSPETLWSDMLSPTIVYENGEYKTLPPFSGEEEYEFPGVGSITVVNHIHEELFTIPRFIKGLKRMTYKAGWHPLLTITKAIGELGLWDDRPVDVKGVKVVPRDLLIKLLKPIPTPEELAKKIEADLLPETVGAGFYEVKGEKSGLKVTLRAFMQRTRRGVNEREALKKYGLSYLERPGFTGVSAAISTYMVGRGDIKTKGVIPPEALSPKEREAFLDELAKEGYVYRVTEEKQLTS